MSTHDPPLSKIFLLRAFIREKFARPVILKVPIRVIRLAELLEDLELRIQCAKLVRLQITELSPMRTRGKQHGHASGQENRKERRTERRTESREQKGQAL